MTDHEQDNLEEGEDAGLSLDALSAAYAEALGKSDSPFESPTEETEELAEETEDNPTTEEIVEQIVDSDDTEDPCEVSPRTILEAMLFVGNSSNEPLTADFVASKMRGVQPEEVADLVDQLNNSYQSEGCPYEIITAGTGYRMSLLEDFAKLREKFYGKVREAKLSQPAIDVLSLVAYNQGLTREEADELRGKPSGPLLNQLVRRQLLRLERETKPKRVTRFFTTDRFLKLFRLGSLEDLPQPEGIDLDD